MGILIGLATFVIGIVVAVSLYYKQKKASVTSVTQEQFEKFEEKMLKIFKDAYLDGLPEIKENKKKKVLLESTDLVTNGQFKGAKDKLKGYIREFSLSESEKAAIVDLIGLCYLHIGQLDESLRNFEEVRLIGERIKDHYIQGLGHFKIGVVNIKKGDLHDAQVSYLSAMKHFAECNSFYYWALTLSNLGVVFFRLGDIEKAKKNYKKSLSLAKQNNNIYMQALNLRNLGSLYCDMNQDEKAQSYHEEALKLFQSLDDVIEVARQLHMLGHAYLDSEPGCVFRTKYPPIPAGKSHLIPVESPTSSPERSDEILF